MARDGSAFYRGSVSPSQPAGECHPQEGPHLAPRGCDGDRAAQRAGLVSVLSSAQRALTESGLRTRCCGPATALLLGGGVPAPHSRPSQPPLTVLGLPPGRLVVELSGTLHTLPFPGWPCRGPLHTGHTGHPRGHRPGWLVLGWTSRQHPAQGGGARCPAALHAGGRARAAALHRGREAGCPPRAEPGPSMSPLPVQAAVWDPPRPQLGCLQGGGSSHQAPAHVCGPAGLGTETGPRL